MNLRIDLRRTLLSEPSGWDKRSSDAYGPQQNSAFIWIIQPLLTTPQILRDWLLLRSLSESAVYVPSNREYGFTDSGMPANAYNLQLKFNYSLDGLTRSPYLSAMALRISNSHRKCWTPRQPTCSMTLKLISTAHILQRRPL